MDGCKLTSQRTKRKAEWDGEGEEDVRFGGIFVLLSFLW